MSFNGTVSSHHGYDAADHQAAYIYTPNGVVDDVPVRTAKRRRVVKQENPIPAQQVQAQAFRFDLLLNGRETPESANLRQGLFEICWSETEERIQSVLEAANEGILAEVTSFVKDSREAHTTTEVPAGFIVTGPNIASQGLLFKQLSSRLKSATTGPVVVLRSGDASNLKAALKKIIRDATSQKLGIDDESLSLAKDGPKLLDYDLEILHSFVKFHGSRTIVVAFQDIEGFDNGLVTEMIILFSSWMDRIPFVLFFGIATSVDLFQKRLSRIATRCLSGVQFDVEQTSVVLEKIFQRVVVGFKAPLRLGSTLVSSLMERQHDHVQSVQSFTAALKYAYMSHFYGNALSILIDASNSVQTFSKILQLEHLEAVRMLPSFKILTNKMLDAQNPAGARDLIEDDKILLKAMEAFLASRNNDISHLLRVMHILMTSSSEPIGIVQLYMAVFDSPSGGSDFVRRVIDSTKRMIPEEVITFLGQIEKSITAGCPEMGLDSWADDAAEFLGELAEVQAQVTALITRSRTAGKPIRTIYAIHNKGIRTTVIAQRVQLSYEKSTISTEDEEFTGLIDHLSKVLEQFLRCENPQDLFLHEVWLYDSIYPYKDIFTPQPRHAIEHALSAPHNYLGCACCNSDEGISATQPPTASIYQMYLEAGPSINVSDLWRAFLDNRNPNDDEDFDERQALVSFYRTLADLKLLDMVKQSKKKADHLIKTSWKGL